MRVKLLITEKLPDAKYDKYVNHIVNTMLNYQNMQFEVNPIDQT